MPLIEPVITGGRLAETLGVYAGLVDRVLDQPEHWLAAGPAGGPLGVLRRAVSGDEHPGSPGWDQQPLAARTGWWARRISATAGTAAAAPRLSGLLADRFPLQAALSASASGLAVCAVARENGIEDPEQWVPLLAQVVFDRELEAEPGAVPAAEESEQALSRAADDETEPPSAVRRLGEGGRRAVRGMWLLARTLLELQGVFDDRPRGGLLPRLVAKLPVVGVVGGWLDERGAVHRAAQETQALLAAR